jgi:hypothetical protein
LAGRARNDCLVGGETLGVDAYVELGGDHPLSVSPSM